MKTFSVHIDQNRKPDSITSSKLILATKTSLREILASMSAVLVAASIITLSVWAAGTEVNLFLGAGTWALAFIFLGLAVDNQERTALLQMMTGLALLVLALLQNYVSPDFLIVSGTLVASWVAAIIFKRVCC
ncbi:MAG: hypothetical protein WBM36_00550 [Lysobacterales bacterium]